MVDQTSKRVKRRLEKVTCWFTETAGNKRLTKKRWLRLKHQSHLFVYRKQTLLRQGGGNYALAIPKKNEGKVEQRPLVSKVRTLLSEANIDKADLVTIAASKGHYKEAKNIEEYPDDFLSRWVIPNFKKIIELINTTKKSK